MPLNQAEQELLDYINSSDCHLEVKLNQLIHSVYQSGEHQGWQKGMKDAAKLCAFVDLSDFSYPLPAGVCNTFEEKILTAANKPL